jgi:hypothetical protein
MPQQLPSLPSDRAFVVQFRSPTEDEPLRCEGRIEHLASGQATRFQSWEQIRYFVEQTLTCIAGKPP